MKNFLKGLLIGVILALGVPVTAQSQTITQAPNGGTGLGSATTTNIGQCLTVSSTAPFRYKFAPCGSGGGTTTTPQGPVNSVQFNSDDMNFGGDAGFTFNSSTDKANLGFLTMNGTIEAPFLINLAEDDPNYEYGIGRSAADKSWSGLPSFSFHVNDGKSVSWFSSSWTKLMELVGSSGNLRVAGTVQSTGLVLDGETVQDFSGTGLEVDAGTGDLQLTTAYQDGSAYDSRFVNTSGGDSMEGRLTITGGTPGGLYIYSESEDTPSAEGIYAGYSPEGSGRTKIELSGGTESYIDFTNTGLDFEGRIYYDQATNVLSFFANGQQTMHIDDTSLYATSTNFGSITMAGDTVSDFTGTNLEVAGGALSVIASPTFTSITSTNAFFTNLSFGTAIGTSLTSTNISFTRLTGTSITTTNLVAATSTITGGFFQTDMPDCDNAIVSKLLYDITTGKYSCGVDQTGGSGSVSLTATLVPFGDTDNTLTSSTNLSFTTSTGVFSSTRISTTNLQATSITTSIIVSPATALTIGATTGMGLTFNGITNAITPFADNTHDLGSNALRFNELFSTNVSSSNVTTTNFFGTNGTVTRLTLTNGTSTNFFSTGLTFTNLSGTRATSTDFNATRATFTSVTSTNISFTRLQGTGVTSTNLSVSGLTALAGLTFTNATGTGQFRIATTTVTGGFFQTGMLDCDTNSSTLQYDVTTGKFSCFQTAPSSIERIVTVSSTWTKPTNPRFKQIKVWVIGGGGAGGGAGTNNTIGAGGGGGGCTFEIILAASITSSTVTTTVGAGGVPGAAGNNAGTSGGTSSFGVFSTATGGAGGVAGNAAETQSAAGVGTGGDYNANGRIGSQNGAYTDSYRGFGGAACANQGDGANQIQDSAAYTFAPGGLFYWGGQGAQRPGSWDANNRTGLSGAYFGAGGSGGQRVTADVAGGAGRQGAIIIVEEYE